jgi:hypothetical protein
MSCYLREENEKVRERDREKEREEREREKREREPSESEERRTDFSSFLRCVFASNSLLFHFFLSFLFDLHTIWEGLGIAERRDREELFRVFLIDGDFLLRRRRVSERRGREARERERERGENYRKRARRKRYSQVGGEHCAAGVQKENGYSVKENEHFESRLQIEEIARWYRGAIRLRKD